MSHDFGSIEADSGWEDVISAYGGILKQLYLVIFFSRTYDAAGFRAFETASIGTPYLVRFGWICSLQ